MGERIQDLKGKAKEAVGDVTDDRDLQREGKADQMAANVKGKLDDAKDKLNEAVDKVKDKVTKDR